VRRNKLILWKWSSIWIKILNDAAYNLNWIKFGFNWNSIQFRFDWILFKYIEFYLNSIIGLRFNSIDFEFDWKKWDANWWTRYWKSVHEYNVEKKNFKKTIYLKDALSCLLISESVKQIWIWNCSSDNYDLWNLKLPYLN